MGDRGKTTVISKGTKPRNIGARRAVPLYVFIAILFFVGFIFRLPEIWNRQFDPDEFEHMHAAFSIASGMVPYRDFFEHHPPLLWVLLQPLFCFFHDPIQQLVAARVLMMVIALGICAVTFSLGNTLAGKTVGSLSVVLLVYTGLFLQKAFEVRPDVPELFLWLFSLRIFISACQRRELPWFFLAGLLAGASILCSQKVILGIGGLIVALFVERWQKPSSNRQSDSWCHLIYFVLGCLLPLGIVLCIFFLLHSAGEFLYRCVLFNALWTVRVSPVPVCLEFLRENPMIFSLGCVGLLVGLGSRGKTYERRVVLGGILGILCGILLIPVLQRQYLLLIFPFWSILGAEWLTIRILEEERQDMKIWDFVLAVILGISIAYSAPKLHGQLDLFLLVWFFIFVCAFVLVSFNGKWIRARAKEALLALFLVGILFLPMSRLFQRDYIRNAKQREYMRIVLEETEPEDPVFDGWSGYAWFRPHAYYYFFLHREIRAMLSDAERGKDVVAALRRTRPKIVINDGNVQRLSPEVREYIYEHYRSMGLDHLYRRIESDWRRMPEKVR